ncbi:unnamed protein product [Boreogadus saida]
MTTKSQKRRSGPAIRRSPLERCRATGREPSLIRPDPLSAPSPCVCFDPCVSRGSSSGAPQRGPPLYNLSRGDHAITGYAGISSGLRAIPIPALKTRQLPAMPPNLLSSFVHFVIPRYEALLSQERFNSVRSPDAVENVCAMPPYVLRDEFR